MSTPLVLSKVDEVIVRQQGVVEPAVEANDMVHYDASQDDESAAELTLDSLPEQPCSVPLDFWLNNRVELLKREHIVAVQIAADEQLDELSNFLSDVPAVVLPFVSYVDGRSYSHAYLLRTRYGYQGQIRAIGAVHFDHLNFLARVGVDQFELPEGHDVEAALTAFGQFTEVYQPSADAGQLIFSRRRAVH